MAEASPPIAIAELRRWLERTESHRHDAECLLGFWRARGRLPPAGKRLRSATYMK
jgi:hypothetical protein